MSVHKRFALLLAVSLVLLGTAPAVAQESSSNGEKGSKDTAVKPASPVGEDSTYVIGAGDNLSINVWREQEVSRTIPVRPDGKISLPLLNDVQAAGLTPMQLGLVITERLKKFMADPQVTIIVAAANSQRFYIVGEVGRAGAFNLTPDMTVLQALASAGGFTQFADLKKIYILRTENGKAVKLPFNYKEVIKGNLQEQNILLKPGDTIVVP